MASPTTTESFQRQLNPVDPPALTEANLPDQSGKVFIVTGGNTGIGGALAGILYQKNGTVYIASRSAEKANAHIASLKAAHPASTGRLAFLKLVLDDLATVKSAALEFATRETRLDVLFNNAGVASSVTSEVTAQGHAVRMGTNALGAFVFTHHLYPLLKATAATSAPNTIRVVWTGSLTIDLQVSPNPEGLTFEEVIENEDSTEAPTKIKKYAMSKLANWLLASEFAKRFGQQAGIVSLALNPGNLDTGAWADGNKMGIKLYDAKYGAYTNLWVGLSEGITVRDGVEGKYGVPWGGAWHTSPREDIVKGLKSQAEGGTGVAERFFDWAAEQTKEYL